MLGHRNNKSGFSSAFDMYWISLENFRQQLYSLTVLTQLVSALPSWSWGKSTPAADWESGNSATPCVKASFHEEWTLTELNWNKHKNYAYYKHKYYIRKINKLQFLDKWKSFFKFLFEFFIYVVFFGGFLYAK